MGGPGSGRKKGSGNKQWSKKVDAPAAKWRKGKTVAGWRNSEEGRRAQRAYDKTIKERGTRNKDWNK